MDSELIGRGNRNWGQGGKAFTDRLDLSKIPPRMRGLIGGRIDNIERNEDGSYNVTVTGDNRFQVQLVKFL